MIDQKVWNGVAERCLASWVEARERGRVLSVFKASRKYCRKDRLTRDAHVQARQTVAAIERADQLALSDRMVGAVGHVLLARPDHLDWDARHLLGNQHSLAHIVGSVPPAETTAEMDFVDFTL